jgi:molybdopterin molybdotransferase
LEFQLSDLISVSEAQQRILEYFSPLEYTEVELLSALNRILYKDIPADQDYPIFSNSGMDGFAVTSTDVQFASNANPVTLKVIGDIPAGSNPQVVISAGTAARIMTGAQLPLGADAVVPLELTNCCKPPLQLPPDSVTVFQAVKLGEYIRPKGQDLSTGQVVLRAGSKLKPQDIGLLALLGYTTVPVYKKPNIAILSTGDELVIPGAPLPPGKIRDVNTYSLSLLSSEHQADVLQLGMVPDHPEAIQAALQKAVDQSCDLIVSSAGVSVGAFDYFKDVIEQNGELTFWRVNMRPGKPVAFGKFKGVPVIGLPGNPVSAFVCFLVFVVPAIQKLSGRPALHRRLVIAELAHAIESDGRESYLRAFLSYQDGKYLANLTGHQGSGNIFSLSQSNALLIVPSGVKSLPASEKVRAWILDNESIE